MSEWNAQGERVRLPVPKDAREALGVVWVKLSTALLFLDPDAPEGSFPKGDQYQRAYESVLDAYGVVEGWIVEHERGKVKS